ncbi:MAG: hypothetical protein ABIH89_01785 [Elusimicrobiota bacterium]
MKITTPFDNLKELGILINEGADELYCGVAEPGVSRHLKSRA